jgi:hypothetical protein
MGASFNGLGLKGSEISVLTKSELTDRQAEAGQFLKRTTREHSGQKLMFSFSVI